MSETSASRADCVSYVLQEHRQHVLKLTLNRPEKRNALTSDMYLQLAHALRGAARPDPAPDRAVHVVLLRGQSGIFCSGNDIESFLGDGSVDSDHPVFQFMHALAECPVPVVASVDGMAVGIGATLLLHCDLVYASPRSRFQFPFARLGLCPEFASSLLLPRIVGATRASAALLLGDPIPAQHALEWGLVNELIPEGSLNDHACNRAQALAALGPDAVQTSRRLLRASLGAQVAETMAREQAEFLRLLATPAVQQGFHDFLVARTRKG